MGALSLSPDLIKGAVLMNTVFNAPKEKVIKINNQLYGLYRSAHKKTPENNPISVGPNPASNGGSFSENPNAKIKSPIKYKLKPTTNESETIPTSIFLSLLLNIKDAESKIIEIIKNGWHINLKK